MRFRELRPLNEANIVDPEAIDAWLTRLLKLWTPRFPDDPAISPWLIRRVRQYLSGLPSAEAARYMPTLPDENTDWVDMAEYYGDWVYAVQERGETLFHFTPEKIYPRVVHILQYLTSLRKVATEPQPHEVGLQAEAERQTRKITRLTLEQAEAHADQWFARLQAANREHAERADTTSTKPIMDFHDGFRWVEIMDSAALDREGDLMQHCVGGGSYDEDLENGKVRIFSLRDKRNQPHVTVEANSKVAWDDPNDWNTKDDEGDWKVVQVKGKQNEGPSHKYARYVGPLLTGLKYPLDENARWDIGMTGLFRKELDHDSPWGTLSQVGILLGHAGRYQVYTCNSYHNSVFVAEGDEALVQFNLPGEPTDATKIITLGISRRGDYTVSPPDFRAAVQLMLDDGYRFKDSVLHYLAMSQVVIQDRKALLASELPMVAEVGGYRATVLKDMKQEQALLWVIQDDEIAAYIILWTTPKIRQVDHIDLMEPPSLPLAQAIADAFTALRVNGLTTDSIQKEIDRVVHRPGLGFPWEPAPRLRRQGDAR